MGIKSAAALLILKLKLSQVSMMNFVNQTECFLERCVLYKTVREEEYISKDSPVVIGEAVFVVECNEEAKDGEKHDDVAGEY